MRRIFIVLLIVFILAVASIGYLSLRYTAAKNHYTKGLHLHEKGRLGQAEEEYRTAIKLFPWYADAYYELASIYLRQGQAAKAIKYAQKAIKLRPNEADYYVGLAFAYYNLEQDEDSAYKYFQKAVKLDGKNFFALYMLGKILEKKGQLNQALGYFKQAALVNEKSLLPCRAMARVYEKQKKFAEAILAWEKVLRLDPDNKEAKEKLAKLRSKS
jgi:cytochrome c-type biogenesis protein CcmH/NrfG